MFILFSASFSVNLERAETQFHLTWRKETNNSFGENRRLWLANDLANSRCLHQNSSHLAICYVIILMTITAAQQQHQHFFLFTNLTFHKRFSAVFFPFWNKWIARKCRTHIHQIIDYNTNKNNQFYAKLAHLIKNIQIHLRENAHTIVQLTNSFTSFNWVYL